MDTPVNKPRLLRIIKAATGDEVNQLYWYVSLYKPAGYATGRTTRPWQYPVGLIPVLPVNYLPRGVEDPTVINPTTLAERIAIGSEWIDLLVWFAGLSLGKGITAHPGLMDVEQMRGMPVYHFDKDMYHDTLCHDCGLIVQQDFRCSTWVCVPERCPLSPLRQELLLYDKPFTHTNSGQIP